MRPLLYLLSYTAENIVDRGNSFVINSLSTVRQGGAASQVARDTEDRHMWLRKRPRIEGEENPYYPDDNEDEEENEVSELNGKESDEEDELDDEDLDEEDEFDLEDEELDEDEDLDEDEEPEEDEESPTGGG